MGSKHMWTDAEVATLREMVADRAKTARIAERLGLPPGAVLRKARALGLYVSTTRSQATNIRIKVPRAGALVLEPQAHLRNISVDVLISRCITQMLREPHLVGAILDDRASRR